MKLHKIIDTTSQEAEIDRGMLVMLKCKSYYFLFSERRKLCSRKEVNKRVWGYISLVFFLFL